MKPLRRVACLRNVGPKRRRRDRQIYLFLGQSYAIHRRYTEHLLLCVPYGSLQGVTVRPVPCNCYVIQQDIAFHGGNTGSNPVGDAKSFQELKRAEAVLRRHKKEHREQLSD